jgi:acetolactate synthase I/II/III large subunit
LAGVRLIEGVAVIESVSEGLRVADVIAQELARSGLQWAFGHPGGEVTVLIDALARAGIPFLLTHHENTAAFMAGACGEMTGRPGACVATLGPGATNMVTGVANALLDRAPLVAITATVAANRPHGTTHQDLDLPALYAPITKASIQVTPQNAASAVRQAIAISTAPRMGPVHLSLGADVAASPMSAPHDSAVAIPGSVVTGHAGPTAGAMDAARALIESADEPVVIAGLGAVRARVHAPLRRLVESLGAMVAVTPKAKGIIDEAHPLFAGVVEVAGEDLVVELFQRSRLAILVGVDVVELDKEWRIPGPILNVDSVPHTERYYEPELELVGDLEAILDQLAVPSRRERSASTIVSKHRDALRTYLCPEGRGLQPWQVMLAVRERFGPDTVATCDTGAHKFLVSQLWEARSPGSYFVSNGLSSMGYAIPTAMAARLVGPDRPTVALVGDGGLAMYLGELGTIQRLGLDLTIVVFVDGSLELIRRSQLRQGVAIEGTLFAPPDFPAIARAFGGTGHDVHDVDQLDGALRTATTSPGLHLIAAHIDGSDYRL